MKKFDMLPTPFHSEPILLHLVLIKNGIGKNRHPTDWHGHDPMPIFGRVPLCIAHCANLCILHHSCCALCDSCGIQ